MKTQTQLTTLVFTCIGALAAASAAQADPPSRRGANSHVEQRPGSAPCPHTANRRANAEALAAERSEDAGPQESESAQSVFGIIRGALLCGLEETCKTPCEELEEAMKAESGEDPWGGVGCYDGEVLICVFPENFIEEHDDEDGTGIAKKCIQAHEDAHGHQCKCDEKGKGLKTPQNDLKSDAHEGAALGAEIECYAGSSCADADDREACQAMLDDFKDDACTQYEERMGQAHSDC